MHLEEGDLKVEDLKVGSLLKVVDLRMGSLALSKEEIWLKLDKPAVTANANPLKRWERSGRLYLKVCNLNLNSLQEQNFDLRGELCPGDTIHNFATSIKSLES